MLEPCKVLNVLNVAASAQLSVLRLAAFFQIYVLMVSGTVECCNYFKLFYLCIEFFEIAKNLIFLVCKLVENYYFFLFSRFLQSLNFRSSNNDTLKTENTRIMINPEREM